MTALPSPKPGMQRSAIRLLAAVVVASLLHAGPAVAAEPPKGAVPLMAVELLQIYGGKTWRWGEGGGYFDLDGRKFRARTVSDRGETRATGTWKITDKGRLCFKARWGSDDKPVETCFEHVAYRGDVYQRRLPDGDWYIFRHAKTDPADEHSKLVGTDLVGGEGNNSGGG